jgi:phosphoglycolate phosphatase-like HAD superfamily hydrolase
MNLVVFDVDGTLTETIGVDGECFVRSMAEVFGFEDVNTDWSSYRHATDSGILLEVHQMRTGRGPLVSEVIRFRKHFVTRLTQAWHESPFAAVPGAAECISALSESEGYRVALATGGWRDSARLKMASAGMCYDDHPSASADDSIERETIISIARQRAIERHGEFERVVYVGDGVWDARACRNLELPFIGIGTGEQAKRLRQEGAAHVLPDFGDRDLFLQRLDEVTQLPSVQREALR